MVKELSSHFLGPQAFENAVMSLVKKPGLSYMRDLRKNLDDHPDYLEKHKADVMPQIDHWLSKAGIYWDAKVLETNWEKVVRDVVVRLRSIEKSGK